MQCNRNLLSRNLSTKASATCSSRFLSWFPYLCWLHKEAFPSGGEISSKGREGYSLSSSNFRFYLLTSLELKRDFARLLSLLVYLVYFRSLLHELFPKYFMKQFLVILVSRLLHSSAEICNVFACSQPIGKVNVSAQVTHTLTHFYRVS